MRYSWDVFLLGAEVLPSPQVAHRPNSANLELTLPARAQNTWRTMVVDFYFVIQSEQTKLNTRKRREKQLNSN